MRASDSQRGRRAFEELKRERGFDGRLSERSRGVEERERHRPGV